MSSPNPSKRVKSPIDGEREGVSGQKLGRAKRQGSAVSVTKLVDGSRAKKKKKQRSTSEKFEESAALAAVRGESPSPRPIPYPAISPTNPAVTSPISPPNSSTPTPPARHVGSPPNLYVFRTASVEDETGILPDTASFRRRGVIRLDVGGVQFTTSLSTITSEKNSMLAAMFSGRWMESYDHSGQVFLDRDGETFRHILNWLRSKRVPRLKHTSDYDNLIAEARYFQLDGLLEELGVSARGGQRIDQRDDSQEREEKEDKDRFRKKGRKERGKPKDSSPAPGAARDPPTSPPGRRKGPTSPIPNRKKKEYIKSQHRFTHHVGRQLSHLEFVKLYNHFQWRQPQSAPTLILNGLDMRAVQIHLFQLSDLSCQECTFSEMGIPYKTLNRVDLRGANLAKCNLEGSEFYDCLFSSATFEKSRMQESTFSSNSGHQSFQKTIFSHCNMHGARFQYSLFKETDFSHSILAEGSFSNGNFQNVTFRNANLSGVLFDTCTFFRAKFTGAVLTDVTFTSCKFSQCHFDDKDYYGWMMAKGAFRFCQIDGEQEAEQEDEQDEPVT
mmetsp:Transcript_32885/g.92091  ORF Transcript_32885/g.92091 Transcript_32885/m.92091 type:complete len:556 (-) Transcript_32885:34-1701(-)